MNKHLLLKMSSIVVVLMMFVGVLSAQTKTPTISTDLDSVNFADGTVCVGRTTTMTLTVMGENLKGDITLSANTPDVTLSKTTIKQAEEIGEIEVTIAPKQINDALYGDWAESGITIKTEGAKDCNIVVSWWTAPTAKSLADVKICAGKVPEYTYFLGVIAGEVVMTKDFIESDAKYAYVQDKDNAEYCSVTEARDAADNDVYKFMYVYYDQNGYVIHDYGELVRNEAVTPKSVTIDDLKNNPTTYTNWLVSLTDVTFKDKGWSFGGQMRINQEKSFMYANMFNDSDLATVKIPEKADITGIFDGTEVVLRSKADVISKDAPTAVEEVENDVKVWTEANMLMVEMGEAADVEVYNTVGQRIAAQYGVSNFNLQVENGIYLVKVNGAIYKTIAK